MASAERTEILFICTGNYYRSRFAEALFNFLAEKHGLSQRAFSRGVAVHLVDGPLSRHTAAALRVRDIPFSYTAADRCQLSEADLLRAVRPIALQESEHRPYLQRLFPGWENRIEYWHFQDVDFVAPEIVLPDIEAHVIQLVESYRAPRTTAHP